MPLVAAAEAKLPLCREKTSGTQGNNMEKYIMFSVGGCVLLTD